MTLEGLPVESARTGLESLAKHERRRAVLTTTLRSVLAFGVVLGVYFLLPVGDWGRDGLSIGRLVIGIVLFAGVLAWQVRQIFQSAVPALQAIEALIIAIPTFIVVYASTYVSISAAVPDAFTQPMTKTDALYFTVVTLGTVGFGDIAPVTTAARMAVSSQVLLDLVLIALIIRLLAGAARRSLDRRPQPPSAG
jgi:voltage-gated potassium channel